MRVPTVILLTLILNGTALGQSSRTSDDSVLLCVADAKWSNTNGNLNYSLASQMPVSLSLLAHMSKGAKCSTAEITFTATYLTETQDLICSGTIRQAMEMTSQVQSFNLDVRPFAQLDFLRWRNQPGAPGIRQGKRLACTNVDGTSDLGDNDRQRAGWIRLSIAVLPSGGGMAVTEAVIRVSP